jgi:hypothetical protein
VKLGMKRRFMSLTSVLTSWVSIIFNVFGFVLDYFLFNVMLSRSVNLIYLLFGNPISQQPFINLLIVYIQAEHHALVTHYCYFMLFDDIFALIDIFLYAVKVYEGIYKHKTLNISFSFIPCKDIYCFSISIFWNNCMFSELQYFHLSNQNHINWMVASYINIYPSYTFTA